jgi:TolB protein
MRIAVLGAIAMGVVWAVLFVSGAVARSNGLIAFSIEQGDYSDLYVIRPDGTGLRRLTKTGDSTEESPTWSPDGRSIAFSHRGFVGVPASVDVIGVDGAGAHQLFAVPEGWAFPSWSPDGHWIAFTEWLGHQGIYLVRSDGQGLHKLPGTGDAGRPSWSPDSKRLAYTEGGGVRIIAIDGSGRRQVTHSGYSPAWSPDGRQIALSYGDHGKIWVVSADGKRARQLTRGNTYDTVPTWSSDGKQIAFIRSTRFTGGGRLYVMDTNGAHQRAIGPSSADLPAWQP